MRKPRAKTKQYVNNADLFEAMKAYKQLCEDADNSGEEKPDVPRYIGECIWHISKGISMRPNFSGYTFREDMVMDGIENCLLYMHNFNPERTSNPFGYFTQIIWYAFLRRIAKEKKQMYIRYKSSHELLSLGQTFDGDGPLSTTSSVDYINAFIEDYESKMANDKKAKQKPLVIELPGLTLEVDQSERDVL